MNFTNKCTLLSPLILTVFLNSCSSDTTKPDESLQTESAPPAQTEETHQHTESEPIQLNDGAKWKVDDKMLGFIRTIETEVHDFSEFAEKQSLKMYHDLAAKISTNLDSLTSNCTMSGQAHDELHKWLLPMLDLSESFSASTSVKNADSLFSLISVSFLEFNLYFE
ncbi:MAG: hypothetical protein HYZ14_17345 [Bacteroidetes bacterium]|nr:hypothetical protein [Bacteroidota bacterium]